MAVLFDFGGTLDGPGDPWTDRFVATYREAAIELPVERVRAAVAHGTRRAYDTPQVAGFDLEATVAFHVACQFTRLDIADALLADRIVGAFVSRTVGALADSRAVLDRLSRRFKLGVVSNYYGNVARILAGAGIAPLLSAIVDSTVVGVSKPDPGIFALAVARLGVRPADALFVGDSLEQDIVPARAAGLRTAWLVGLRSAPDDSPADIRVKTLAELERVLLE